MKISNKYKIALSVLIFTVLIILTVFLIDLVRYNQFIKDYNSIYKLEINGKKIDPALVDGKDFIFHEVKGSEVNIKVPKESKVNLEQNDIIIDSNGFETKGNINYLSDGKYSIVVKKGDYKYTYKLNVDNDFFVDINEDNSFSAGFLVVNFYDLNKDESIKINTSFNTSEKQNFKVNDMVIPIDYNNSPGSYDVTFSSEKSEVTKAITIKDYTYNESHFSVDNDVISDASLESDPDVKKKYDEANNLITEEAYYLDGGFLVPSVGSTTGDFGDIRYINGDITPTKIHYGIDYANVLSTNVYSSAKGKVAFVGFLPRYGNVIVIDHGNGITSHYFHLETVYVNVGDVVDNSVIIGGMGTTGYSTGVHLHFEIHINGIVTNPYFLLNKKL